MNLKPPVQSPLDEWSEPINLSQSGTASNPEIVVDVNRIVHVIWDDEFSGEMYSYLSEGVWSEPQVVSFPFGDAKPKFLSDENGFIHAFWVGETNALLYSRVMSERFGNADAWNAPQALAASAINFDVSIDSQGFLHLGYIRNIDEGDAPEGIYYKRSEDSGNNWSTVESIYTSPYYRSLTVDNTNIDLSSSRTADFTNVFITWDLKPRGQVFYNQSTDGGETWGIPVEIGNLYPDSKKQNYTNVRALSVRDDIIILWQENFTSAGCSQIYASSTDGGENWSEPHTMLGNLRGCALDNTFIGEIDGLPLLKTTYQNTIYLSIWNGEIWSDPLSQYGLVRFSDPQSAQIIELGEQKIQLIDQNQMITVGIDASEFSDIWVRTRDVPGSQEWFPSEDTWSDPAVTYSRDSPVHDPVTIGGLGKKKHLFWSEIDNTRDTVTREAIFYSEWNDENWSTPNIIARSPEGTAVKPRVVIDSSNRFLLIWGDPQNGSIYFSWANAYLATGPAEWSEPVALPASYLVSGKYDIAVDSSGTIYVVYAIRLNEGRGIYLTHSSDLGSTWSEPVQVFDGVGRKWQMVDDPRISITNMGKLILVWTRYNLPGIGDSLGIYASQSQDGGTTWSEEFLISGENVGWSQLFTLNGDSVFCFWQIIEPGFHATMVAQSQDGGVSWSQPESIGSTWESQGLVAMTKDSGGKLHLIKQMPEKTDNTVLMHWEWNGMEWLKDENSIVVNSDDISRADSMAIAVSQDGILGVLLYGPAPDQEDQITYSMIYSNRKVEVSAEAPVLQAVATPEPTAMPTEQAVSTLEPIPSQAAELSVINRQPASPSIANNFTGAVFGVIITGILVVGAFSWRIYRIKSNKQY
jgi:hypothetical protein